jgi:serine O-acetyltransferase
MERYISTSLALDGLCNLIINQTDAAFPDGRPLAFDVLKKSAAFALQRLEHCFSAIDNKYFFDGKQVIFDHLHGDQYAAWLYLVSNQLYQDGAPTSWSKKLFLLNKMMHGCDIFYEVELPSIFLLVHPIGTVLGRGIYQDYFIAYQRCGIGSNHDVYPRLGQHVTLRPGSAVLGNCLIGDNVAIATESLVLDYSVPTNSIYFGNPRDHWTRIKSSPESIWRNCPQTT